MTEQTTNSRILKRAHLIDIDLPRGGPITDSVRRFNLRFAHLFRGSIRIALGKYKTDAELERFREEEAAKRLP